MFRAIFERTGTNPLREAVRGTFPAARAVGALSFFLNLLVFAPSLYVEGSFDRVLASRNLVTWGFLTAVLVLFVVTHGVLSHLRQRILVRVGVEFDQRMSQDLFLAVHRAMTGKGLPAGKISPVQAMRDLDTVRENLTGRLAQSAVDLLFAPLFLLVITAMHPFLGLALAVLMIGVGASGFFVNMATAGSTLRATAASLHASEYATTMLRNSEVIHALGMVDALQARWKRLRDAGLAWTARASDDGPTANIALAALSFGGSTLVVSVALILVVQNMVSAGVIFGVMVISGKTIAPMTALAKNWKSYVATQYAFERIDRIFTMQGDIPERMVLPKPTGVIAFDNVTAGAPGSDRPILRNLSFELGAGEILAVIGPSAAGKSSLARVLMGVWPTTSGAVRLDGNELAHWNPSELGRSIGYVPQDVELFPGTIAENIARFGPASSEEIIEAARLAGVHEVIQGLAEGYNTEIGEGGARLSGGQRQRIALARAVLGKPPIVVLDEPNASLDTRGEECLVEAVRALKRAGSSVLIITHRSNLLAHVDRVLVMSEGTAHLMGSREEVMKSLGMVNVVPMQAGSAAAKTAGSGPTVFDPRAAARIARATTTEQPRKNA